MKLEVGAMTEVDQRQRRVARVLQTDRTDTGRILESKMMSELPLTFNRNFQSAAGHGAGRRRGRTASTRRSSTRRTRCDSRSTASPAWRATRSIEGLDDNQKTGLLQVIIPAADALETVSVYDQQLRRGVRPLGRRDHERDAEVGHQRPEGQRVLLRQQREDERRRLLQPHQGADQVRQRRVHARRPDRQNKLFFFGDYQRTIDNTGYVVRTTVPTAQMRSGDFSAR